MSDTQLRRFQDRHQTILALQKKIIRAEVLDAYDRGEINEIPDTGQQAGFRFAAAEGWTMKHIYHSERFDLFMAQVEEGAELPVHTHNQVEIMKVRQGGLDVMLGDRWFQVQEGSRLLIPSDTKHKAIATQETEALIEFAPPIVLEHDTFLSQYPLYPQ